MYLYKRWSTTLLLLLHRHKKKKMHQRKLTRQPLVSVAVQMLCFIQLDYEPHCTVLWPVVYCDGPTPLRLITVVMYRWVFMVIVVKMIMNHTYPCTPIERSYHYLHWRLSFYHFEPLMAQPHWPQLHHTLPTQTAPLLLLITQSMTSLTLYKIILILILILIIIIITITLTAKIQKTKRTATYKVAMSYMYPMHVCTIEPLFGTFCATFDKYAYNSTQGNYSNRFIAVQRHGKGSTEKMTWKPTPLPTRVTRRLIANKTVLI